MPRKPKPTPPHSVKLSLGASLDLKEAAPLTERLQANRGQDLTIDGSQVQRLGGQCLQVLLAACEAWKIDGRRFAIQDPSPAVTETMVLLGVGPADLHHQPEAKA